MQAVVKEVTDPKAPPTILFLDEIHTLVGAGSAEGTDSARLPEMNSTHDLKHLLLLYRCPCAKKEAWTRRIF
jgi:hypothetical protein